MTEPALPPMPATPSTGLPLAGIRVVALEQAVAAPLCSRHLGDLGADVIKVEHPDGGDFSRHYDDAVEGLSANFVWLNHGKRSVALDLRTDVGREALERLLADGRRLRAQPGTRAPSIGWVSGQRSCRGACPRLVWCAISGYGPDGPLPRPQGLRPAAPGRGGRARGHRDARTRRPRSGVAARRHRRRYLRRRSHPRGALERERTGRGRRIDISLFDCLTEWMSYPAAHWPERALVRAVPAPVTRGSCPTVRTAAETGGSSTWPSRTTANGDGCATRSIGPTGCVTQRGRPRTVD